MGYCLVTPAFAPCIRVLIDVEEGSRRPAMPTYSISRRHFELDICSWAFQATNLSLSLLYCGVIAACCAVGTIVPPFLCVCVRFEMFASRRCELAVAACCFSSLVSADRCRPLSRNSCFLVARLLRRLRRALVVCSSTVFLFFYSKRINWRNNGTNLK